MLLSVRYLRPMRAPTAQRLAPNARIGCGRLALEAINVIICSSTPPTSSQPLGNGFGGGNTGDEFASSSTIGSLACSAWSNSFAG